jgi:hypothetical protein
MTFYNAFCYGAGLTLGVGAVQVLWGWVKSATEVLVVIFSKFLHRSLS